DEIDSGGQVAPLVATAELERAAVTPVQLEVVDRLHDLVAELGVADAAGLEPRADRLLGEHAADAEVLPDVAQPVDGRHAGRPLQVVDDDGAVRTVEVQVALDLRADALDPAGDHLRVVERALG